MGPLSKKLTFLQTAINTSETAITATKITLGYKTQRDFSHQRLCLSSETIYDPLQRMWTAFRSFYTVVILVLHFYIRGQFAKFVDSPYYSESELRGGAVTVSFSKYLPWQAMHFLQRSTHFSKTCCRPLITSKFLVSELPFHGRKSCSNGALPIHFFHAEHRIQFRSRPMRFMVSSNHEKGAPRQEISKHVFEKWVERCKKCIACRGRYFEKETVTALPQSSDSE
jgi:hypothetical protein